MDIVFLDSSFLLAVQLSDDINHPVASKFWAKLADDVPEIVTTSFVFAETTALLNGRGFHRAAKEVGNDLLTNPDFELVFVERDLFDAGWKYLERHEDKRYSFADCVSFVLMERRGISTVLTFDRHFAQAGFEMVPKVKG